MPGCRGCVPSASCAIVTVAPEGVRLSEVPLNGLAGTFFFAELHYLIVFLYFCNAETMCTLYPCALYRVVCQDNKNI